MRNAYLKLRLFCWITMVGLIVLSCASPDRNDDLSQESSDLQVNDTEISESSSGNSEDLGDLGNLDSASSDLSSSSTSNSDLSSSTASGSESMPSDIPQSVLIAPSDKEIAKAAKEMAAADAAKALAENSSTGDSNNSFGNGLEGTSSRSNYSGSQRVPKIPGAALTRRGARLNRFYFVRRSDTPESVAQLLYGSPNEASKLISWNGKAWKPGKLIYYSSPFQPEDQEMRSFYQERNVQPEEYQIEKGETLIKIAKKKYGNGSSWKEIAVINGFSKLNAATPGTRIALYPSDLKTYAANPSSNNGFRRNAPQETTAGSDYPGQGTNQTPPPQYSDSDSGNDITNPTSEKPKSNKGFNLDFGKLFQQNMVAIVFGGGLLILLLLLSALSKQRKKKSSSNLEDFNDDGFGAASPKRSKR